MRIKMEARIARQKADKKEKKSKKLISEPVQTVTSSTSQQTTMPSTSFAGNASESSSSKSTKANVPKHVRTSTVKREASDVLADPEMKKLKNGASVATDPKATDVYKSLFTSHKSEKEQNRAHWVTYNPFYN